MASFVTRERTPSEGQAEMTKYPIKRLEISIKNFIKVLSIALDRLHKHSANIKRLTAMEDWPELHKEQVNATRTVQQVTANIKEIEKVRCQVNDEDLSQFDDRVSDVKSKAITSLDDFLGLLVQEASEELGGPKKFSDCEFGKGDLPLMMEEGHPSSSTSSAQQPPTATTASSSSSPAFQDTPCTTFAITNEMSQSTSKPYSNHPSSMPDDNDDIDDNLVPDEDMAQTPLLTTNLHVIPENSEASASWDQLRENIEDLNELVHDFAERVEEQGEPINCIEDNIDSAQANVAEGTSHLGVASKYKAAMFPAVGAVLGGVLGGPIGFVAGLKIGGLAAVTGGAVGFGAGRFIKNRQNKIMEMEMTKLSSNTPVQEIKESEADHPPETNSTTALDTVQDGVKNFVGSIKGWFDGVEESSASNVCQSGKTDDE